MKTGAAILALSGLAALVFSWWGLETAAGRRQFDEMAGMIPFFAGIGGAAALVLAAVLVFFARR